MEEFDFLFVARKSIRGVAALISRTFLIQILGLLSFLLISARLDPSAVAVFAITQAIIAFLTYFQDVGFAASLIQKKEEPTQQEYQGVFTAQQGLVLLLVIPALIFSPQLSTFYNLNIEGLYLLIALLVSFFLSSMRTIPTVMMERKLDFGKLVVPQVAEYFVMYLSLIIFVFMGLDIMSFTYAVLLKSIVGLIATYIMQPWRPALNFHFGSLKQLIKFGAPIQANSILALIKDDLLILYLGKVMPFTLVGYITFAQKLAFYPLRLIMDNVIRITFPSYSRLQHDPVAMKIAIEKSLFLISFFIFPTAFGIMFLSEALFRVVPVYGKWFPAVLSISFFAANTIFSSLSTPLVNFLNAIGKVKVTLYFMAFWTAATWILTILLVNIYGYNGVAIASFLVSLTSVFVVVATRRYVVFSFIKPTFKQFASAVIMGLFILSTRHFVTNFPLLIAEVIISGLLYVSCMLLFARTELLKTGKFIYHSVRHSV